MPLPVLNMRGQCTTRRLEQLLHDQHVIIDAQARASNWFPAATEPLQLVPAEFLALALADRGGNNDGLSIL